jgi:hypothetical protein
MFKVERRTKMEWKLTKKAFITLGLIFVLFVMIPSAAFSWNQATHAYISERLGARVGHDNLSEMWGSVGPDLLNFIFDSDVCPGWISDQTHGTYSETFMKVWNAASTKSEKPLAYGFLTHNQSWGADFTAHVSGRTFGQEEGYIITKAKLLLTTPCPANHDQTFGDAFASFGMDPDEGLLVAHLISEYAIDIMLRNDVDPLIGRKLATAARDVTKRFPALLTKAFAKDYADQCFGGDASAAADVLTAAEKEHRKNMIFLGQAISQSKPVAVQLLAEQVVGVLSDFLGGPLLVPEAQAVEIVNAAIYSSMDLCNDYREEIDATIEFVGKNLEDQGITY